MINRWLVFTACLLAGGGLGYWVADVAGLAFGVALSAFFWLLVDSFYLARFLIWLRAAQSDESPSAALGAGSDLPGLWGVAADRIRRLARRQEHLLHDSQARLDEFLAAMQASPSGVVLLDSQNRIEWCNQMAALHFGFDARKDVLQHISNLVRSPAFKSYLTANDFSHDVVIPGSASVPGRPVNLSVHVHAYGKDRKLLLSRDITALELAEAMRRDFVANVSHEIRTPLTVLSGFIETLQTLPLKPAERERYLGLMAQQSQRMQTLVNDLLTLSRLEGSPHPGGNEWVSVSALFAQSHQEAQALSALLAPNTHTIRFDNTAACEIAGEQGELYSALSNLVTNAVRYTPAGGSIQVAWHVLADGRGELIVKDSGPGIAEEHISRLTERFYRIDRSRSRETGGTGLGLAIVKHVAQRHNAELHIESQLGQGSSFSIRFPSTRVRAVQGA